MIFLRISSNKINYWIVYIALTTRVTTAEGNIGTLTTNLQGNISDVTKIHQLYFLLEMSNFFELSSQKIKFKY